MIDYESHPLRYSGTSSDVPLWQDGIPPYNEPRALQAVEVAKSYWNVRNTHPFIYSNGSTFLDDGAIIDNDGKSRIDCSTFIHLVLRGLRFEDSPFVRQNLSEPFPPSSLVTNAILKWADDSLSSSFSLADHIFTSNSGVLVRHADEIAKFYLSAGRVFIVRSADDRELRPGDLVFYKGNQNKFLDIGHVGIVAENTSKIYNVISSSPVVALSNLHQNSRTIAFFARPDYGAQWWERYPAGRNYLEYALLFNNSYPVSSNVHTDIDPIENTIRTYTETGSPANDAAIFHIVNSEGPLFLPKGTYMLYGAPPYKDRRSGLNTYFWGLRIRRPDNAIIPYKGFGYDSINNQIVSQIITNDNHVWDRGYGAIFKQEADGYMYASIYISKYPANPSDQYENTDQYSDIWRPVLVRIDHQY